MINLNSDDLEAGKQKEGAEVRSASRRSHRWLPDMSWKSAAIGFLAGAAGMLLFGVLPLVAQL